MEAMPEHMDAPASFCLVVYAEGPFQLVLGSVQFIFQFFQRLILALVFFPGKFFLAVLVFQIILLGIQTAVHTLHLLFEGKELFHFFLFSTVWLCFVGL